MLVVFGEEAIDGGLQVDDGSEHATLEPPLGQRGEEALDSIEPRGGGGRKVKRPTWMAGQPCADLGMLVGGVVCAMRTGIIVEVSAADRRRLAAIAADRNSPQKGGTSLATSTVAAVGGARATNTATAAATSTANDRGDAVFAGGPGGGIGGNHYAGGSGGGAAGPGGPGGAGLGESSSGTTGGAPGGGGGANYGHGAGAGVDLGTTVGGPGGIAGDGTAGGTAGVAGSHGSGGGGGNGSGGAGGAGGPGAELLAWDATHGPGGGGGGGGGNAGIGGTGGLYGGGGGGGYPAGQGRAGGQGMIVLAWGTSVYVPPPTPAVLSDLVRQTLYAGEGALLTSDLVRMVLRSSGTGAGTYLVVDDLIRQTLRSTDSPSVSRGGPMTSIIM